MIVWGTYLRRIPTKEVYLRQEFKNIIEDLIFFSS